MYIIVDTDLDRIVACHDEKRVARAYIRNFERSHPEMVDVFQIKKEKHRDVPIDVRTDLYLVRYGHTYVPYEYYTYLELVSEQPIEDLRYVKEILMRIEESKEMSNKTRKHFDYVIKEVSGYLNDALDYTSSMQELVQYKDQYDLYIEERKRNGESI